MSSRRWRRSTRRTTRCPSDISLAQASADQKIEQSKRAVEIETLKAQAEVEPIKLLAAELSQLYAAGAGALQAYLRNVRLKLFDKVQDIYLEANHTEVRP